MARLIPKSLPGKEPQALRVFWQMLRKLPDDFSAWWAMDRAHAGQPQVFLLWRERYGFLIQVAETTHQLAERALRGDLFDADNQITPEMLGRPEQEVLLSFVRMAGEEFGPLQGALAVRKLVVFPNVMEHMIDEVVMTRGEDSDVLFLGLHQSDPQRFGRRLEALAEAALPAPEVIHLRRLLTPESEVPRTFNARARLARGTSAELDGAFLDIDQEWCVKNDLVLPPEQERVAGSEETRLVTGVAGSGKSLVLLYRAVLFARHNPDARVLVLTHNRALRFELERRAEVLAKQTNQISCMTFFQWASECLGGFDQRILFPDEVRRAIDQLRHASRSLEGVSTDYLVDEIGWIKDQAMLKPADYLEADRRGRGLALKPEQKAEVWELLRSYQNLLDEQQALDWHNVALRFRKAACVVKSLRFPSYDAILIDEAQFFAKSWFEVVQAALKPGGHLFLAADPTQGFLRRRQSWVSAGIEVRGRTTRLATAYRNTRAILRFAMDFYQDRRGLEEDEMNLNIPSQEMLDAMTEPGTEPELIWVPTPQDELARAVNEVVRLKQLGLEPGALLLLHTVGRMARSLAQALELRLGPRQVHLAKQSMRPASAFCSVAALDAATGLEAPVVMLLGMDMLLESEADPRLSHEERAELRRDHTRKLYMGFTRAGQKLLVFRRAAANRPRGISSD